MVGGSPPLYLEHIGKKYVDKWVLRDIVLRIDSTGLYVIWGDNGSGKTTLLKITAGLLRPSKGNVYIFGHKVGYGGWDKSLVNVLLHENIMYDELTVEENLDFYSRMYGLSSIRDSKPAYKAFEAFGLEDYMDYRMSSLSYGWRKRVNIVRALINRPRLLLLDEPTIGLDMDATSKFVSIISEYSRGSTVLFTISDVDDLQQIIELCDVDIVIYRLEDGGIRLWEAELSH